jgi:WD40 repeat protein
MSLTNAISVLRDGRWIVCGTRDGASVWDATSQEMAIKVEGTDYVHAVDISPESARFATATGGGDNKASIWKIITGEKLVGPLQHDGYIAGIQFFPNGEHIATAVRGRSIHVFDSRNGDQLITINASMPSGNPIPSLAWSNNGQQIFAASSGRKIKSFDVSTGSQLAESQDHNSEATPIALAANRGSQS